VQTGSPSVLYNSIKLHTICLSDLCFALLCDLFVYHKSLAFVHGSSCEKHIRHNTDCCLLLGATLKNSSLKRGCKKDLQARHVIGDVFTNTIAVAVPPKAPYVAVQAAAVARVAAV
jgi:hypothetical protein